MTFTLINAGPSPFGRKVAIALIEKGLDYIVEYDLPWSEQTCTPKYSPLEQLPILIEENGNYVYDSVYILEWLERRYPEVPLLPNDNDGFLEAKLRQMLGESLLTVGGLVAFELHRNDPSKAWVDRQERKLKGVLTELNRILKNRIITDNQNIDLGDIAVATALLVFESSISFGHMPDVDIFKWRGKYSNLTSYIESLETRPSFTSTKYQTMDFNISSAIS